ncbi:MAG: hypothetical protein JKY80_09470 [Mariprofundaceae bacterium]|nr:hypothetical protein [Mariprofundaceae bacterium]
MFTITPASVWIIVQTMYARLTKSLTPGVKFGRMCSLLAFVIMFPVFFLYHNALALGVPPFLGGYFGVSVIIALPLLIISYWTLPRPYISASFIGLTFWLLILFMCTWIGLTGKSSLSPVTTISILKGLVIVVGFYLLGRTLVFQSKFEKFVLYASFAITFLIVVINTKDGVFSLGTGNPLATYQFFGLIFLFVSIATMGTVNSTMGKMMVFAMTSIALVFNGSRSDGAAFLIAVIVYILLGRRSFIPIVLVAIVSVVVYLNLSNIVDLLLDSGISGIENNRFVDLLVNHSTASLNERAIFKENAMATIGEHFVVGAFGSYKPGEYSHNLLSMWVDFGLLGFLMYVFVICLPLLLYSKYEILHAKKTKNRTILALYLACVALLIFAKMYLYPLFFLSLGLMAQHFHKREI